MRRKFILTIILCSTILLNNINIYAANFTSSLKSEKFNKTVTVTLSVSQVAEGLDALSGTIEYDKAKLEFVEVSRKNTKWQVPSYNDDSGKFTILINSEAIKEANEVISITFKIKDYVSGNTEIKVTNIVGATSNNEKILSSDVNATVIISEDVNEDNDNTSDNNTNIDDSNNSSNDDSSNSSKDEGNNVVEETDENNKNEESNNSQKNNIISNDGNNTAKDNTTNNIDNTYEGKLPQTGEKTISYVIIGAIVGYIIISIVMYIKKKLAK